MLKICFAFQCIVIGLYATELKKVYVYHTPEQALCNQAELAKVVFHFDQDPKVESVTNSAPHKRTQTYFFPARISDSVHTSLEHVNKNDAFYQISCSRMQSPNGGLRVQIHYDPRRILCIPQTYDAITGDKGFMLQIVHKQKLSRLLRAQKKMTRKLHKRPKIVLDFGHGGKDSGAIGLHGAIEKEITLRIGTSLAELLQAHGYEVFLTRHNDTYLSLPERAASVHSFSPDFLISIHANSGQPSAAGIETYCLTPELFSSWPQDNGHAFNQLIKHRCATSLRLAQAVHTSCIESLKSFTADRGIRHAVSQVLLASNVPGILIEVGFVSNDKEARLLIDTEYQTRLAEAIFRAVSSL